MSFAGYVTASEIGMHESSKDAALGLSVLTSLFPVSPVYVLYAAKSTTMGRWNDDVSN